MRHHGFSHSSLYKVTSKQAPRNLLIDCIEERGLDDHSRPEYIAIFIDGTEGVQEIMDEDARKEIQSLEEHIDQLEKEKEELEAELKQARRDDAN